MRPFCLTLLFFCSLIAITLATSTAHAQESTPSTDNAEKKTQPAEVPIESLLAGEFALQEGQLAESARWYVDAAQTSSDTALAERAARLAAASGDTALFTLANSRWRELVTDSPDRDVLNLAFFLEQDNLPAATNATAGMLDEKGIRRGLAIDMLSSPQLIGRSAARKVLAALLDSNRVPSNDVDTGLALAGVAEKLADPLLMRRYIDFVIRNFPLDLRARLLDAQQKLDAGDRSQARTIVNQVLAEPGLTLEQRRAAATILGELKDYLAAAANMAIGKQTAETFAMRARWLDNADDAGALRAVYDELGRAAESRKDIAMAALAGMLAERLELWGDAENWFRIVLSINKDDVTILRLADMLDRQGRGGEGVEILRKIQKDDDADGELRRDAFIAEAAIHQRAHDDAATMNAFNRGLAILEDDPALLYARAMQHEANDRLAQTFADLDAVLDNDPDNAQALNAYGYTLIVHTTRYDEALRKIQRAHKLEPTSPAILDSLGWVLFKLGRHQEALPHLQAAWAGVQDPEIAAHLGEALWTLGKREQARRIWLEASKKFPDNETLKDTMQRLDKSASS